MHLGGWGRNGSPQVLLQALQLLPDTVYAALNWSSHFSSEPSTEVSFPPSIITHSFGVQIIYSLDIYKAMPRILGHVE